MRSTMLPEEMNVARELFLNKKYKEAAESFSQIRLQTEKDFLRQKAFLGQVCSQMLLAENETQSQEVLQLWQTWCRKGTNTFQAGDLCLFLTPVVGKWADSNKKGLAEERLKKKPLSQCLRFPEGSDLARELASQKKEVKKLRTQIKKKNQDIEELKAKLKALEDINQEIDQKKKGMDLQ